MSQARALLDLLLILIFLHFSLVSCRVGAGKEQIKGAEEKAFVVQLTVQSFNSSLKAAPAKYSLVEFFASWCPHCQHYKPKYEKVGALFNDPKSVHYGKLFVAAVDCPAQVMLCNRFDIEGYPTIWFGESAEMAVATQKSGSTNANSSMVKYKMPDSNAESLLKFISLQLNSSFSFAANDLPVQPQQVSDNVESIDVLEQSAAEVHDIEQATAMAYELAVKNADLNESRRKALVNFLTLLSGYHLSIRCRVGSTAVLLKINTLWPEHASPDMNQLLASPICGSSPSGTWKVCKGSRTPYTCGLWMMFHSMSVRVDEADGPAWLAAVKGYVDSFFQCDECRRHFLEMANSKEVAALRTKKDVVMWLWRAHNKVNVRVGSEEVAGGESNPQRPKRLWPSPQLCAACVMRGGQEPREFNETAVYDFLVRYYGGEEDAFASAKVGWGGMDGGKEASLLMPYHVLDNSITWFMVASVALGVGACSWSWRSRSRRRKSRRRSTRPVLG